MDILFKCDAPRNGYKPPELVDTSDLLKRNTCAKKITKFFELLSPMIDVPTAMADISRVQYFQTLVTMEEEFGVLLLLILLIKL